MTYIRHLYIEQLLLLSKNGTLLLLHYIMLLMLAAVTGAPGMFDLTEVNAKSEAIGITNNSFTTDSGHRNEAIVIHKNAMLAIPGQMQH